MVAVAVVAGVTSSKQLCRRLWERLPTTLLVLLGADQVGGDVPAFLPPSAAHLPLFTAQSDDTGSI